jgi:hypothetical protein
MMYVGSNNVICVLHVVHASILVKVTMSCTPSKQLCVCIQCDKNWFKILSLIPLNCVIVSVFINRGKVLFFIHSAVVYRKIISGNNSAYYCYYCSLLVIIIYRYNMIYIYKCHKLDINIKIYYKL